MLFNKLRNNGADTPLTNPTRTQFVITSGKKYKPMATYTERHILQLNGL